MIGIEERKLAEASVIGSVLFDNSCFAEVSRIVKPEDFHDQCQRRAFQVIVDLMTNGGAVDAVMLANGIANFSNDFPDGPLLYCSEVAEQVPHTCHAAHYAGIVRDKSIDRQSQRLLESATSKLAAGMPWKQVRESLDLSALNRQNTAERFRAYSATELDSKNFNVKFLVEGIMAAGIPSIVAGALKTLKTSIVADLHLSLVSGTPFLDEFPVNTPVTAAAMSGESGMPALKDVYRRVAASKGIMKLADVDNFIDNFILTPDLPQLADAMDAIHIREFIARHELQVLFIDPMYLSMDVGSNAGNQFAVGSLLLPLSEIINETGCTIIIVAHNNKASATNYRHHAELTDIQWSGLAEWAGQWLLTSRRSRFNPESDGEHELWMNCGGRAGHSLVRAIDIAEGRLETGRYWRVDAVMTPDECRDAKKQEQEARPADDGKVIVAAMESLGNPDTKTAIRKQTTFSGERFNKALKSLITDGKIRFLRDVRLPHKRNGSKYDAYELIGTTGTVPVVPVNLDTENPTGTGTPLKGSPGPGPVSLPGVDENRDSDESRSRCDQESQAVAESDGSSQRATVRRRERRSQRETNDNDDLQAISDAFGGGSIR